jgi:RNA polymerase-interacting CarD/CdnL/TRCF family regulator
MLSNFEQKIENPDYAKAAAIAWRRRALSLAERRLEVIEVAKDLVELWKNPKIQALSRADRNSSIEDTRQRLIEAIDALKNISEKDIENGSQDADPGRA